MERSRTAPGFSARRSLHSRLAAGSGVPTEVRWVPASTVRTGFWQVQWSDGPTVATMRRLLVATARDLPRIDPERFEFQRTIGPVGCALAMVRNVRAGRPPLGDDNDFWQFAAGLDQVEYPDRGAPADIDLARALVRRSSTTGETISQLLTEQPPAGPRARPTAGGRPPVGMRG